MLSYENNDSHMGQHEWMIKVSMTNGFKYDLDDSKVVTKSESIDTFVLFNESLDSSTMSFSKTVTITSEH